MALGTLDRTPPPFFRQGPTALTRLVFFSALAVFLMVADTRFRVVEPLRAGLAMTLMPLQRAAAVPLEMWHGGGDYLRGLRQARADESAARAALAAQSVTATSAAQLAAENARLRALLELRPALAVRSTAAEVMYEAADPFSRKVFIDRGRTQGVALGSPVINEAGVLGQVTHLYPLTAEVTLLADKDAAIPVLNTRTQQLSAAFGGQVGGVGGPGMELRFMSGNADVQVGDELHTSGLDGIYPPGLAVARVASVERRAEAGFARILLTPAAPSAGVRHVLVLEPTALQLPPRPEPAPVVPGKPLRKGSARPVIMPRGSDQLLLPVNPFFIGFTLLLAFGFNLLPLGPVPAMPDVLAVTLMVWTVHQPRRVGVGVSFLFGLLMDVHQGALLGQHALGYTLLSFLALVMRRRLLWFGLAEQTLQVLPVFVGLSLVSLAVGLLAGGMFPGWTLLLAPVWETLLWPLLSALLLAPQRRAPDPDQNRPL